MQPCLSSTSFPTHLRRTVESLEHREDPKGSFLTFGDWTIQLRVGEQTHRLFGVSFEEDGTYSVSAPYHCSGEATVFKVLEIPGVEQRMIIPATWQQGLPSLYERV
jgi:hypothetical protein